uniref:T cell receptor delta variable 3 n=1 Tax=Catagonus wagneri TaxID=51154 RepID=A0A8C3YSI7_9CETA
KMILVGFGLFFFYKVVLCNKVTQTSREQTVASGSKVTLNCIFETSYSDPDLFWYRTGPDRSFQFVLYRDNTRSYNANFARSRFSVQHSVAHKTFHLVISSVTTEDTATYYCALGYPQ